MSTMRANNYRDASGGNNATINGRSFITSTDNFAVNNNDSTVPTSAAVDAQLVARLSAAGSGTAKAFVNFNGTVATGTYAQSGNLITVTTTAHGLVTGETVPLTFTTGTSISGSYPIAVTGANTYTVTAPDSKTTSGNVSRGAYIRASMNVASITRNAAGDYTITFTTPLASAAYVAQITANDLGFTQTGGTGMTDGNPYGALKRSANGLLRAAGSLRFQVGFPGNTTLYDQSEFHVVIFA